MMKRYKALMFVLNKRFSHRWNGQISYVLSKSYGNVDNSSEASFGNNSSTNGGGGAYAYETPNVSLVNAQGELTNSRRHEVKVLLGVQVPRVDLGVNVYFRALSGRPYTPYQQFATSVISFPASSGGRRVLIEPRGSSRREGENILDLRLEKIFKLGQDKNRLSVYADITNLFNASTVTDLQYRVPSRVIGLETVDYNSPTAIIEPRQTTFGVRWSF
jgi:hypothetical protein